jgi:hypothetical protein
MSHSLSKGAVFDGLKEREKKENGVGWVNERSARLRAGVTKRAAASHMTSGATDVKNSVDDSQNR